MSDYQVPINKSAIIRLSLIDRSGDVTSRRMTIIDWSLGSGSENYFSISVSSDGLSIEVKPLAVGSGRIVSTINPGPGLPSVVCERTLEIVDETSSDPQVGEIPAFAGTKMSIVTVVGRLS